MANSNDRALLCSAWIACIAAWICGTSAVSGAEPSKKGAQAVLSHVVMTDVEYFATVPMPGARAVGRLNGGTPVQFIASDGRYSEVQKQAGQKAFVAARVLAPMLGSDAVTEEVKTIAAPSNAFAIDLYGQLRTKDGNLFFSPASISTALAMALAGAAGQTEKEMATVLHVNRDQTPLPPQRMHEAFGKLNRLLNSGGNQGGYVLRSANRLWAQQSYAFRPAFLKTTRDDFGAELAKLDFRQSAKARLEINSWVEQQTNQKIENLIPPGVLSVDARLVLTNAIYFLGGWQDEFRKDLTKEESFFATPSETVIVSLMTQTERFSYGETDELQTLELPYRGHEISMFVLLPKKRDGLRAIEEKLTVDAVVRDMSRLNSRQVQVILPKFKMTSEFSLKKTLSSLGTPTAFTEAADFSRMAEGESLMISEVIHKAFMDVNEKGTEAAAATAILMVPTSAPFRPEEPVLFRADHPFLFVLRDNRSGAILFMGRVTNPK